MTLLLGAVAYNPKIVTIWDGFRIWLRERDIELDYVLYSNYERQAEDLLAGRVDIAWHSPLAWLRSQRLARAAGVSIDPVVMRDTDRDLTSVVVVPNQSDIQTLEDLRGRTVAVGAVDSPQATLLPLHLLRTAGLTPGTDVTVVRHDTGVGLHGDHIGGERDAAKAMRDGQVDAACMTDSNLLLFSKEGTLAPAPPGWWGPPIPSTTACWPPPPAPTAKLCSVWPTLCCRCPTATPRHGCCSISRA